MPASEQSTLTFRQRLHEIIFEADTVAGRAFDTTVLLAILASIAVVLLESVESVRVRYQPILFALEWFFTAPPCSLPAFVRGSCLGVLVGSATTGLIPGRGMSVWGMSRRQLRSVAGRLCLGGALGPLHLLG